jgi:hypothetical protein
MKRVLKWVGRLPAAEVDASGRLEAIWRDVEEGLAYAVDEPVVEVQRDLFDPDNVTVTFSAFVKRRKRAA